ncbi:excisionase [Escherichia coli]|uniref:excisionase n=1 Tax=Escherichia coli TaxID=562 RepID=UPI001C702EEF|nr:excisionase [Escherichia coli]
MLNDSEVSVKPVAIQIKSGDLPKAKVIHGRARWLYRDHCEFKNKLLSRANG